MNFSKDCYGPNSCNFPKTARMNFQWPSVKFQLLSSNMLFKRHTGGSTSGFNSAMALQPRKTCSSWTSATVQRWWGARVGGTTNGNEAHRHQVPVPVLNSDYLRHFNLWEAAAVIGIGRREKIGGTSTNGTDGHRAEEGREGQDCLQSHLDTREIAIFLEDSLPAEFCRSTSLHGLKYIGQRRLHVLERIFWTIAFTAALIIAVWMISHVWDKYKRNPVIMTFQPLETKTNEIPFPAITICNMNKILKSKVTSFVKQAHHSNNPDELRRARENLLYTDHICSSSVSFARRFNYSMGKGNLSPGLLSKVTSLKERDSQDVRRFYGKYSQKCEDMVPMCMWQEDPMNCSEVFVYQETDYGVCCTFNMMPKQLLYRNYYEEHDAAEDGNSTEELLEDWKGWEWEGDNILEQGTAYKGEFPRRQQIPGKSLGLSILLNPDVHEYFCTTSDSVGFRVLAHASIDIPRVVDFGQAIPPNSEVFINVKPKVTVADEKIQGFGLDQRQCYFSDEFKLLFYSYYTSTNCLMECFANLTYEACNCTSYYMPRDASRPLCSRKQFACSAGIKKKEMITKGYGTMCNKCLPTCTEIRYQAEISTVPLQDPQHLWEGMKVSPKWARTNASIVHIYFGEESTTARLRTELYGFTDLLANFGGLMGLCLGFSGMSLIEICYFLTVRAVFRHYRHKYQRALH